MTPSFIQVQLDGKIKVQTNDDLHVGVHNLIIKGKASDGSYIHSHSFTVVILKERPALDTEKNPAEVKKQENGNSQQNLNIIEKYFKRPVLEPAPLEFYLFNGDEKVLISLGEAKDP